MTSLASNRRLIADRAAGRIERSLSLLTRPRMARRATMNVTKALGVEISIVVFVGALLFIH